jgi:hypothetical protein
LAKQVPLSQALTEVAVAVAAQVSILILPSLWLPVPVAVVTTVPERSAWEAIQKLPVTGGLVQVQALEEQAVMAAVHQLEGPEEEGSTPLAALCPVGHWVEVKQIQQRLTLIFYSPLQTEVLRAVQATAQVVTVFPEAVGPEVDIIVAEPVVIPEEAVQGRLEVQEEVVHTSILHFQGMYQVPSQQGQMAAAVPRVRN